MAALFEPFPLWLAEWEAPSLAAVPLVSRHKSKVVHSSPLARGLGIKAGSSLAIALSKAPELEIVEADSPYLTASWERLVEELAGLTRTLESSSQGRLLMELEPADAAQLAETYRVRVGMAESIEVATLAALISSPGRVKLIEPDRQEHLLDALPLYVLKGVGLSQQALDDFGWLGVSRTGELRRWSKSQVAAYLGRVGKQVMPYLFGPHRTYLGRYTPAPQVSAQTVLNEPQCEPLVLHSALEQLCIKLSDRLDNKAASRLTVTVRSHGLEFKATRIAKTPLSRSDVMFRLALLALADTHAQLLGIKMLTVELSGLSRPSEQLSLWPQKERVAYAIEVVETRFPRAILKLVEDDPYALASEHTVRFVVRSTGEEVSSEAGTPSSQRPDRREGPPIRA
jgi:nucleotidyltransferase/DNA polymerase involved in DNA repair